MNKIVELPLVEPIYSTYHNALSSASIINNLTIRNYFLNEVMILTCNRKFLSGYTTPEINVEGSSIYSNPYLEKHRVEMWTICEQIDSVIHKMIDEGYYVYFTGTDDFYVEGKSWYRERHFGHDGAICGYNQEDETYCIYAYDSNWIYQKFWTPQKSFKLGLEVMFEKGIFGHLCAIKPMMEKVDFLPEKALQRISEYLDSNMIKYPENEENDVRGIVVHEYIAKYVGKLYDGSIPYEKMDRRVFRMIWEHKKSMLERIQCIEKAFCMESDISKKYEALVYEANTMRTMYAFHHKKRRDSILPVIQSKLIALKDKEFELLSELLNNSKCLSNRVSEGYSG